MCFRFWNSPSNADFQGGRSMTLDIPLKWTYALRYKDMKCPMKPTSRKYFMKLTSRNGICFWSTCVQTTKFHNYLYILMAGVPLFNPFLLYSVPNEVHNTWKGIADSVPPSMKSVPLFSSHNSKRTCDHLFKWPFVWKDPLFGWQLQCNVYTFLWQI